MLHARIAARAFNTPLLVEPSKAVAFLAGLGPRVLGGGVDLIDAPVMQFAETAALPARAGILAGGLADRFTSGGEQPYPVIDGIAVIEISGVLIHRGAWIGKSSGQTSYEGIAAQIDAAARDPLVRGVALEIDSFGGEVAGVFDLADRIRALRASKPVWAFVAEHAFSAGYALASQADRILLPRTGAVGSIGVVVLHADLSGQLEQDGVTVMPDPLVEVMNRKLTLMRRKHAQTREYMEMNALRGIVKDGAGTTLYNYFTEFGLEQISIDFVFGTAATNLQSKVRGTLRAIEDNLLGETMTTAHALVSSEFFDKLIGHPKAEEAYKYFTAAGGQPLRDDMRRAFPFAGILFEEYNGSVTLSNGTTERLIPAGEGIAFPLGTFDTFTTYGGPANLLETANTIGLPLYARQQIDPKGRWIDLMTEASILPVNKRPRLAIRLHSSN